ncbi:hypothetical protein N7486_002861 [Penicillium sp. IBT 16267x]|nr:hypothetical protein N7486_002861 [Penicillium sp. IBT 16267x]
MNSSQYLIYVKPFKKACESSSLAAGSPAHLRNRSPRPKQTNHSPGTIAPKSRNRRFDFASAKCLQNNADDMRLGVEMEEARGMIPLLSKTEYGGSRIIYRGNDLHKALKSAATSTYRNGEPVTTRVSSRVVSCEPSEGKVTLDSGEVLTADVIIGADGMWKSSYKSNIRHSVLRKSILDGEPAAMPTGTSVYESGINDWLAQLICQTHINDALELKLAIQIPSNVLEEKEPQFCSKIRPRDPYTSMIYLQTCHGPGQAR